MYLRILHFTLLFLMLFPMSIYAGKHKLSPDRPPFIQGYHHNIAGEILSYHSCLPEATSALLIRCLNNTDFIEWETDTLPKKIKDDTLTFCWVGGYSTGTSKATHFFNLSLDGVDIVTFTTYMRAKPENWIARGKSGCTLSFRFGSEDAVNDHFGYFTLKVPKAFVNGKRTVRLKVKGDATGSRDWYMTMRYQLIPTLKVMPEAALIKVQGKESFQRLKVNISHFRETDSLNLVLDGVVVQRVKIDFGSNSFVLAVAPVKSPAERTLRLEGANRNDHKTFILKPVRPFTVSLIAHSHTDIGYTELQTEVEKKHALNVRDALSMIQKTRDFPEGSRFRWNVEVLWGAEAFLKTATKDEKQAFVRAVKEGEMDLGGTYANLMTGLSRPEELYHLFDAKTLMEKELGINITAAMISDIPGYAWGLVPAMAQHGVRYFSSGPNGGDRIGHTLAAWGDKPFYWVSPSGKEKVLHWAAGSGYGMFHSGPLVRDDGSRLLEYLSRADSAAYPYDILQVRYTVGGDNGGVDSTLSGFVKRWNEQYESPKLKISTVTALFREFEEKYGSSLPQYRGDLSPYWEDGAGSTALETAMSRNAATRLVEAGKLWTLLDPGGFPELRFREAWQQVLLFSEHTWGAWNSVSDPDLDFVKGQWQIKKSFAEKADSLSKDLMQEILKKSFAVNFDKNMFAVYNLGGSVYTDVVTLPSAISLAPMDCVFDDKGQEVPVQQLSSGEKVFLARSVPPYGYRKFSVLRKMRSIVPNVFVSATQLSNEYLSVSLDPVNGSIVSLTDSASHYEWADTKTGQGLNAYIYTGGDASNPRSNGPCTITVKEKGPVVSSLLVVSEAPGCTRLKREVIVYHGIPRVDLVNTMDKIAVREKENARFAFPFKISNPQNYLDYAWTALRPETDQIAGSNKNYYTIQDRVLVAGDDRHITLYTPDAPLVELGGMTAENWMQGPPNLSWMTKAKSSSLVYSWALNNSWHTNFKADQEGEIVLRYSLSPGLGQVPEPTSAFAHNRDNKLVVCGPRVPDIEGVEILRSFEQQSLVVTSLNPESYATVLRVFNPSANELAFDPAGLQKKKRVIFRCDADGNNLELLKGPLVLSSKEVVLLRIFIPGTIGGPAFPFRETGMETGKRVDDLLSRMTLKEKAQQMQHAAPAIERLGIPQYNWWNEALHGVARDGIATVFPQAIGMAASWSPELIKREADVISTEARAKHHEHARNGRRDIYQGLTFWSPNINIFRDPRWGRGQETFGEDPFLTSRIGIAFVEGLQGDDPNYLKVVATPKHFAVHSGPEPTRHSFDAVVPARDLYETYLPAFEACVREGGAYSVMGAYNRLYGWPCTASNFLLTETLRTKWGFDGYVVSDCGAVWDMFHGHDYVKTQAEAAALAVKAGCDLTCGTEYESIEEAVGKGLLSVAEVDACVRRLMTARMKLGMFDPDAMVKYTSIPYKSNNSPQNCRLAGEVARASVVLLKNDGKTLPLSKTVRTIAVIGPNAADTAVLLGNYNGTPSQPVTILQGIRRKIPGKGRVLYHKGCELTGSPDTALPAITKIVEKADVVVLVMGIAPHLEGEALQLEIEGFQGGDRTSLDLPRGQQKLIQAVAKLGKPLVLVLLNGSALSINWEKDNVAAIVEAWYPGQEGGNAVADVLFGDYNPAGRLPVTFYKSVNDLPPFDDYSMKGRTYKYFEGEALFPFGHGLSYSAFEYVNAFPQKRNMGTHDTVRLHVKVLNLGPVDGDEVVQVYVARKKSNYVRPQKGLVGFQRVHLKNGVEKDVVISIPTSAFRVYDEKRKAYFVEPGNYYLLVGASSSDIRLKTEFEITRD